LDKENTVETTRFTPITLQLMSVSIDPIVGQLVTQKVQMPLLSAQGLQNNDGLVLDKKPHPVLLHIDNEPALEPLPQDLGQPLVVVATVKAREASQLLVDHRTVHPVNK